jgi:hypothetical protein
MTIDRAAIIKIVSNILSNTIEANAELKETFPSLLKRYGLTTSPNLKGNIVIAEIPTLEIGNNIF